MKRLYAMELKVNLLGRLWSLMMNLHSYPLCIWLSEAL